MITFNASTTTANFHCLQDERMRQALHQRLVREALRSRRERRNQPQKKPVFPQVRSKRPLSGTARS